MATIPVVKERLDIQPWIASTIALCASGVIVLLQKTSWQKKSDVFYTRARKVDQIRSNLKYGTSEPADTEEVRQIAEAFKALKDDFGTRTGLIDSSEDDAFALHRAR